MGGIRFSRFLMEQIAKKNEFVTILSLKRLFTNFLEREKVLLGVILEILIPAVDLG